MNDCTRGVGLLRWVPLALLALAFAGCGRRGEVSGEVRWQGAPLSGGWLTFNYPEAEHTAVAGVIGPDGRYRISRCPVGEARVTIRPGLPRGRKASDPKQQPIPPRYGDPETTDLKVTVQGGRQRIDLELKP
jgi:hypothetical protein